MGTNLDFNPETITVSMLPTEVALDAEYIAADKAHVDAIDPHLQYATQARADERYGLIKKIVFTGTTPATQGSVLGFGTNLNSSKIIAVAGSVAHSSNGSICAGHAYSPGYQFDLSFSGGTAAVIYIGTVPANSANILSKPFKIVVDYSLF
jgi:hypothetical protein